MFGYLFGGRATRARLARGASAMIVASVLVVALHAAGQGVARARGATGGGTPITRMDPARLASFLGGVRGASPVACELAARAVYNGGWGGRRSTGTASQDTTARGLVSDVLDGDADAAAIPTLRAALADPDACVRRIAAPILGRIDDPAAADALVAALGDASTPTRLAGAVGVAFVEKQYAERGRAPLVRALKDADAAVREAAAWALGRLELPNSAAPLIDALGDRESRVRAAAASALGSIEDAAAVPRLAEVLRGDADPEVRRAAAWALGQIK